MNFNRGAETGEMMRLAKATDAMILCGSIICTFGQKLGFFL
jgi:hypothetical protein